MISHDNCLRLKISYISSHKSVIVKFSVGFVPDWSVIVLSFVPGGSL